MTEPTEPAPAKVRFPLRLKLAVFALALVIVPLVAVGVALIDVNEDTVDELALEVQLAVLEDTAHEIEAQLGAAEDTLETVGRLLTRDDVGPDAALAASRAIVEGAETVDHVAIYDVEGELIDVIRERAAAGVELPERIDVELRERATEHGTAVGEAAAAELAPRVPLLVPLRARLAGPITGYALTQLSLEPLSAHVEHTADERFHDLPDALLVIDDRGRTLVAPRGSTQATLAPTRVPAMWELDPATFGSEFLRQGERPTDAGAVVATLRTVPRFRWAVAVQQPREVVFESVGRMRLIVAGTIGAAIVIALALGLFFAGRLTQPLRRLVGLATALGERRFGETVDVATSDELATLGHAMSGASRELEASERRIRHEEAIRNDLRRYLPAEIVDRVVRREQDMALGGERREITVLFADVVAFTPLAEEREAEEVVGILNELFTILTEIVFRHGGMVDKFIGDCVMAIWGAPEDQPDHTERAMAAAEEMLRWLETSNASWEARFGVRIELAIGVHRGEAVVGNVGSESRMAYTAIGDVVNVASRLEAIARPSQILVTQEVQRVIAANYDVVAAGSRELAGRRTTIELYEVRG